MIFETDTIDTFAGPKNKDPLVVEKKKKITRPIYRHLKGFKDTRSSSTRAKIIEIHESTNDDDESQRLIIVRMENWKSRLAHAFKRGSY